MNEQPTSSEIARALAAMRRRVKAQCMVCGREIIGMKHRRTCSEACRSKAYRMRQKPKAAETTEENEA